jgi:hypothetical protein
MSDDAAGVGILPPRREPLAEGSGAPAANSRGPYNLKIFFLRHAKSCSNMLRKDYDLEVASQQLRDPPLSTQGIAHAQLYTRAIAESLARLEFRVEDAVIASSELIRAQQTARILFGAEKTLHILPYLAESGDIPENTRRNGREQIAELRRTLEPLFPVVSESIEEGGGVSESKEEDSNVGPRKNTSSQGDKGDWGRFKQYIGSSDYTLPRQGSMIIVGHGAYLTEVYRGLRAQKEIPPLDVKLNNMDGFLVNITGVNPDLRFELMADELVRAPPPSEGKDTCPARTSGTYPPFPLNVAEYPELEPYKTELDNVYDTIMHQSPLPTATDPSIIHDYLRQLYVRDTAKFQFSSPTVKAIFLKMYNLAKLEPIWPPEGYTGPALYSVPGYTLLSQFQSCHRLLIEIGSKQKFTMRVVYIELKKIKTLEEFKEKIIEFLTPPDASPVVLNDEVWDKLHHLDDTTNNTFPQKYFTIGRLFNIIKSSKDITDFNDIVHREDFYTELETPFITNLMSKATITQKLNDRYQQMYVIVPSTEKNMSAMFSVAHQGIPESISFNETRWLQFPPGTFKEEPELQGNAYKGAMIIQGFKLFDHPDIKRALEQGPPSAVHPDIKRLFPELWHNEDLPYNLDYIEGIQYPKDMFGELASPEFAKRYEGDEVYTTLRRKLNFLLLQKTGKSLTGASPEELFKTLTKQELEQAINLVTTADIKAVIDKVRATYMLNKEGAPIRSDPVLTTLERLDQLARMPSMELEPLVRRLRTWRNMYVSSGRPAELIKPVIDLIAELGTQKSNFFDQTMNIKKKISDTIEPIYWTLKGMHSYDTSFNKEEAARLSHYISETLKNAALRYFRATETRAQLENKVVSSIELKKIKEAIYNSRLNREILNNMDDSIRGRPLRSDTSKTITDEYLKGGHDTIIFVAASRTCNDVLHERNRATEKKADPPFTYKGKQLLSTTLKLLQSTNPIHKAQQYRVLGDPTWIIGSSPRKEAVETLVYITEDISKNHLNIFPFVNNIRKEPESTKPVSAYTTRKVRINGKDDLLKADLHAFIEWVSANRSISLKKDITTEEFHPEVLKYLVVTHKDTLTKFLQEEGGSGNMTYLDAVEVTLPYVDGVLQPLEVNKTYRINPGLFKNDAGCETLMLQPPVFTADEQAILENIDSEGTLMNSSYPEGSVSTPAADDILLGAVAGSNSATVLSDDDSLDVETNRTQPILPPGLRFQRGTPVTTQRQQSQQSQQQSQQFRRYGQQGGDYGSYDQQSYRSVSEIILRIFYSKLIKPEYIAKTPAAPPMTAAASAAVESQPSPATKPPSKSSDIAVNLDILSNLADIDPKLACKQILNAPQNPNYTELKTLLGIKEEAGWFGKSLKCPKPGAFETIIGSYKKGKQYTDAPINILKRFLAYANNPKVTDEKVYKKFDTLRAQMIEQIPEKYATVKTELRNVKSVKGLFGTTYPPRKLILQYFEPLMILLQSNARPGKELDQSSTAASRAYELDKIYDIADINPKKACEAILRNPTYFTDLAKRLQIIKKDGWFSDTLTCPPTNRIKQEILAYKKENGLPIIDSKSKILERFMFFTSGKVTGDQILKKFSELAGPFIPANHLGFSYDKTTPVATLRDKLSSMIDNTVEPVNPVIVGQTGGRKYKTAAPTRKMPRNQRGGGVTMPLGFFQEGAQMRGTYGSETGAGLGVMTANMARSALVQTGGRKKATRKNGQRGGFTPSVMGSFAANGLSLLPVASYMGYRMMKKGSRKSKAGRTGRKRLTRRH